MSEKFCLRWNDFESNISSAFKDIREEKEFFDVTIVCGENEQIEAHKVILSACSPLFRTILKRSHHQHPLVYFKDISFLNIVSIINFMYYGEVNVAQDDLNSFLAVAEELKVKGLTQKDNSPSRSSEFKKRRHSDLFSQIKHKKPQSPAPKQAHGQNNQDDDIQEVVPIKSEHPVSEETEAEETVTNDQMMEYGEEYDYAYEDSQVNYDDPTSTSATSKGELE